MSYDLTLFRVPEGADPQAVYLEVVERQERDAADAGATMQRPISAEARKEMQRIAEILRRRRPGLEEFRPVKPLPWIELNDEELQIQFEIYEDTVSITVPYFRDRSRELMGCVGECMEALQTAAGYVAYDPQLGRIVTTADLSAMNAQYRGMDRALPEFRRPNKRPWWRVW